MRGNLIDEATASTTSSDKADFVQTSITAVVTNLRRFSVSRIDRNLLRIASSVLLLLLACLGSYGQTTSGTILGTLTDQSGALIPNTPVKLTNTATGDTRQTVSNNSGFYQYVNIPPGTYRISVSAPGFKSVVREPIELQVEGSVQINISLSAGDVGQVVNVTASTPLLQADTTSLGAVIDQESERRMRFR